MGTKKSIEITALDATPFVADSLATVKSPKFLASPKDATSIKSMLDVVTAKTNQLLGREQDIYDFSFVVERTKGTGKNVETIVEALTNKDANKFLKQ